MRDAVISQRSAAEKGAGRRPPATRASILVTLLCAAVFTTVAWAWGEMFFRVWVLNRGGQPAVAEVAAVTKGSRGGWKIGYRFQAGNPPRWYAYTEIVTRRETTARVSEEQAKASQQTRVVNVVYWPRDPRINRPEGAAPIKTGLLCPGTRFTSIGFLALVSWLALLDELFNRLRAGRRAVESRDGPAEPTK